MVSMVVAVCPLFPPATFVRPHDAKPRVTLTTSAETSTGQGATPLLSAGVLSNGQIRTPGPFRRGVLLSGGRRSATENGSGVARHTFCSYCGMHAFLCAALATGQDHPQRALYRRHRWAKPEAEPLLRRPTLGRSAAQADCRRRPCGPRWVERRCHVAAHPRPCLRVG